MTFWVVTESAIKPAAKQAFLLDHVLVFTQSFPLKFCPNAKAKRFARTFLRTTKPLPMGVVNEIDVRQRPLKISVQSLLTGQSGSPIMQLIRRSHTLTLHR